MKTKIFFTTIMSLLFASSFAQDKTTVTATNSEISDNLDLRAVASIFGDSKDLQDFEDRINDPKNQISNLDLNNDNQVDYIRVIETIEGNAHIIVLQDVIGKDTYQDIASVEVEKDNSNNIQVQVVGDVYMYGSNYIYELVYVHVPVIYNTFWVSNYRPYYSSWYWGYYPSYYYAWTPFPIFKYRHHIGLYINFNNHYNYGTYRRCSVAYNNYYGRRANGYEREYPNRSFEIRNSGYKNRYDMDQARPKRDVAFKDSPREGTRSTGTRDNVGTRTESTPRSNGTRDNVGTRTESTPRSTGTRDNVGTRAESTPRSTGTITETSSSPRSTGTRNQTVSQPRNNSGTRTQSSSTPHSSEPRISGGGNSSPRGNSGNSGGGRSSSGGRR